MCRGCGTPRSRARSMGRRRRRKSGGETSGGRRICRAAPSELNGHSHSHEFNQILAFAEDEGHVATRGWQEPIRTHLPLALSADRARAVCLRVVLNVEVSADAIVVVGTNSRVRLRLVIWCARKFEHFVGNRHALRRVRTVQPRRARGQERGGRAFCRVSRLSGEVRSRRDEASAADGQIGRPDRRTKLTNTGEATTAAPRRYIDLLDLDGSKRRSAAPPSVGAHARVVGRFLAAIAERKQLPASVRRTIQGTLPDRCEADIQHS